MRWPRWLYSLTDPRDPWFGDDKASHWLGAAFAMCKSRDLLTRWHWNVAFFSWFAVVLVILLVEIIEVRRWEQWQAKGAPTPWPWLCDKASLKDIAWGLLGAWMATL
jgi:hypothetical protein